MEVSGATFWLNRKKLGQVNSPHWRLHRTLECRAKARSSEAKTMKTKTWTVIANTGNQAELESGLEKKEVQKPTHISARDFIHWIAPDSHIDDDSLRSLFKL
jgi:hypothetical protein